MTIATDDLTDTPPTRIPDRSAITTAETGAALDAIMTAFGAETAMGPTFTTQLDKTRQAVLAHFGKTGQPPSADQVAKDLGLAPEKAAETLAELSHRDLVRVDDGTITGAYPFTTHQTAHTVHLGGHDLHAMCAVDALGTGAMFDTDVVIDTQCKHCEAPIHIATTDNGTRLDSVAPGGALVWSGMAPANGNSEENLCTTITFFDRQECLDNWRGENHPDVKGHNFTMAEGLEVGRALFGPTFD
ncbi:MAG: hypothetical protein HOB82_06425 [Alphaproteobacteria bacterium]|jgi:mercuric reductase|nr:hypothetical protein [Alphaproteobacteria bacterium]MBT4711145.1 hypothetical protein [Alphaproteobacteria bacterium]MBT5860340.1 hypothetical protein [Alphaproteobacteria bacterium]